MDPSRTILIQRLRTKLLPMISTVQVVQWSHLEEAENKTESEVWLVKTWRVWTYPGGSTALQQAYAGEDDIDANVESGRSGFVYGQALVKLHTTISTCVPPRRLYRAIHSGSAEDIDPDTPKYKIDSGTPYESIKARGREIKMSPLFFQPRLQQHLECLSRHPSPFMSTTSDLNKTVRVAAIYQAKGFRDVRILAIDPWHPSWDYKKSRIWFLESLVDALNIAFLPYFVNEYLIENEIPEDSIVERMDWLETKKPRIHRLLHVFLHRDHGVAECFYGLES